MSDIRHINLIGGLVTRNPPKIALRRPYPTALGNSFQHHEIEEMTQYQETFTANIMAWCCTPTPSNYCTYHISTSHTLQFLRLWPRQTFKGQGHYSKAKSTPHHDVAHLQPLNNVASKYQLPKLDSSRDVAWKKILMSRSLQ